ncbi:hypothetical protein FGG08_001404 [Glutinoglossum americanum]|uniref:Origin recognition complex subunit n=1 Tax=Glutinoglossum americanum TaxID=1670608 RepID=A0A9P8IBF2_9PEZI|nr:hypothetical protein FGG08_001404 [Glutinoglossum americanum]
MPINGEALNGTGQNLHDYKFTDHQACFIYSQEPTSHGASRRPHKKRRLSKNTVNEDAAANPYRIFPPLLNGSEKPGCVTLRFDTYQELWSGQEDRNSSRNKCKDAERCCGFHKNGVACGVSKIQHVAQDLLLTANEERYHGKIPTGLILAGPGIASHGLLFEQLITQIRAEDIGPVVVLTSGEASNLKTILKKLIRKTTCQVNDPDEDTKEHEVFGKGPKLLSYDLQILYDYVKTHDSQKVTIAFQDSEAFDGVLLGDLITLFSSWLDRIPFVVLFGVATSIEIFHEKLPRSAIRCLQGEKFDVERVEESLEKVFDDALLGPQSALRLGPALCRQLLDRQKDHIQNVQAFVSALKYAYMSHFYANPLSILLAGAKAYEILQKEHLEAIRNLPSFRRFVEKLLDENRPEIARSLLDDDGLLSTLTEYASHCRDATGCLLDAIKVLEVSRSCLQSRANIPRSELYVKAVSGELKGSVIVRDLLLSIKKMPSGALSGLLGKLAIHTGDGGALDELLIVNDNLQTLINSGNGQEQQLRSEHDIRHETLRTTVVAQKVEISVQKTALSKQDSAYSKFVNQVHDILESYFSARFINPQDIFLHEIFFYDFKSPHRDVFAPKLRFAIERALSAPHDYLGCNCCGVDGEALESTQPPTAILYQLYQESGALVNVFDLWSAFYTIVGGEDGEDCDESNALALFYRAMAELKHLGMVKHSKKKTDHVAKLVWKGL